MKVCMYLRKSRADEELEKILGEGETLYKHRKALLKLAKEKKLNIVEIKEELVSADSIFFRPKMVELLKEVESNLYDGILVMDIQRLGRGDTEDQGIITRIFKESHTKIITPQKLYDLDDEIDEDYFEFESFMGRKEYKMIKKRMQGGRIRSIEDGNYISPNSPYGYDIQSSRKSRILIPNKTEMEVVKLIFKMYVEGNGSGAIAQHLNSLGYKTKNGNNFERSSIIFILKNPVYIGKITWKKKEIKKSKIPGKKKDTRTREKDEWIVVDGKHEPLIDINTWNKAKDILDNRYHVPYKLVNGPSNPLAGLIICQQCGAKMVMRKLRGIDRIMCNTTGCGNISHRFDVIEKNLIDNLERYLSLYEVDISKNLKPVNLAPYESQINSLNNELVTLNNQKMKLFDLLERGIYDEDTFLERNRNIDERISKTEIELKNTNEILEKKKRSIKPEDLSSFKKLIDGYKQADDIKLKNKMMKALIYWAKYNKEKRGNDIQLIVKPKLIP